MTVESSTPPLNPAGRRGLSGIEWLICIIAAIGFAFDIYEVLVAQFVLPPAIAQLGHLSPALANGQPNPEFKAWVGKLFYIPAICGGVFGLIGGYLTDRLGRRRVLTWSILLYAVSAFLAGCSTSLPMLLVLRCTTFVGVCVEFVAAVAWLAELFTEPKRRERVLGYTQAFSSLGGILAATLNGLLVTYALSLPAIHGEHEAWRYTLISGVIPAIPLILIRPFLPESPEWARKRAAGTLRRPSLAAIFSPELARTTVVTTIIFACGYGAAFGAIQQTTQIVAGMPDVQREVKAALAQLPAPSTRPATNPAATRPAEAATINPAPVAPPIPTTGPVPPATKPALATASAGGAGPKAGAKPPLTPARVTSQVVQQAGARYGKVQEIGGLFGRIVLALLVVRVISRRALLRVFQVPGLVILPLAFGFAAMNNRTLFHVGGVDVSLFAVGIFLTGFCTVAQFSFWGNYLPLVYPTHLRGTGESFAANIGGRMIGTCFAWVTSTLATAAFIPGQTAPAKTAAAAAVVGLFVYLVGVIATSFLPEPPREAMPE